MIFKGFDVTDVFPNPVIGLFIALEHEGKGSCMRSRAKQRELKKEERLDSKNQFGINDPTPKQAVNNIIDERRKA